MLVTRLRWLYKAWRVMLEVQVVNYYTFFNTVNKNNISKLS